MTVLRSAKFGLAVIGLFGAPAGWAASPRPALTETSDVISLRKAAEQGSANAQRGLSYNADAARDAGRLAETRGQRGERPEGIPGLLIDDLVLKGIYRTTRGYVAQVGAANQRKSYLLKEGDQLYDGDVVSISRDEVVLKQAVHDPTALKPFREVVLKLDR